ncbi:MAG: DNA polymerase III subunit chi [Pseudomonadota bacterium]
MADGPEIRFYHLQTRSLEQTLPVLLRRCLEREMRAVVRASDKAAVERLADHLWTYDDRSFLPHGSDQDGHAGLQPIWITSTGENPNGGRVLFLLDPIEEETPGYGDYELVCLLFDGRQESTLTAARDRWKALLDGGHRLTYWQQDGSGRWEKKHETGGVATA